MSYAETVSSAWMKACTKCGERKRLDSFSRDRRLKSGRMSQCKACKRSYNQVNAGMIAATTARYRIDHKPSLGVAAARYAASHRPETATRKAGYYQRNKERIGEIQATYRNSNRPQIAERAKARRSSHQLEDLAHRAVTSAIRSGRLQATPCGRCELEPKKVNGRQRIEAHHDDYSKPLKVRFLCTGCHGLHHRENPCST